MGVTAMNVYSGLFGPLLITDQRERALQISGVMPSGKYDVPLVLKDYWSEKTDTANFKGSRIGRQGRKDRAAALQSRSVSVSPALNSSSAGRRSLTIRCRPLVSPLCVALIAR
jgi:hypothetical protein